MSWKAKAYLLLIWLTGIPIALLTFSKVSDKTILIIILWVIIATPFEIKPIQVSAGLHYTLSFAIHLALIIIYGQNVAIIVAAFVTILTDLHGKKGPVKLLFNVSQFSITIYLAGTVFSLLKKSDNLLLLPEDLLAFLCASVLYISVNLILVAVIVALTQRRSVFFVLKRDFGMIMLYYTALAPISLFMVILYKEWPLSIVLIIPPLAIVDSSFRHYLSLRMETRKTLEILADIVDCRDHSTAEHSKRVTLYAGAIAEEMGIDDFDKELIELAGRVHDLGKIAISDGILMKPVSLTNDEIKVMQAHPDVAYNILKPLKMYRMSSIIVREHHERHDGLGYPQGKKEKNIHLGARIIAVADAFDAMTSDRPYRKGMTPEEALAELKRNSGTQFDPVVVAAFIRVYGKMKGQMEVG